MRNLPSIRRWAWSSLATALLSLALSQAAADAAPRGPRSLSVQMAPDATAAKIDVTPRRRGRSAFVEIIDPATGHCLRTLYAAAVAPTETLTLPKASGLPAGKYRVRYREGVEPVLAGRLGRPDAAGGQWLNPTDLFVTDAAVYVLEAGLIGIDDRRPKPLQERTWTPSKGTAVAGVFAGINGPYLQVVKTGTTASVLVADLSPADAAAAAELDKQYKAYVEASSSYIYKFDREGKPDESFSQKGRLPVPYNASTIRSLAVDDQGLIYVPSGSHSASVLTPAPSPPPAEKKEWPVLRNVSGYEGIATSVRETVWVNSVALGPSPRLYISHGGAAVRIYDRTKPAFEGILYNFNMPTGATAAARWLTADPALGALYVLNTTNQLQRCTDDGKQIVAGPLSDATDRLASPAGLSASGELVAVACHGPGFGPYWDSGGGGEVALYWDDTAGKAVRLVGRWGQPGTAAEGLWFLNPSAATLTPDHLALWVVEDGLANKEGPPGNARVRRFDLHAGYSEEAELDLTAWK